MEQAKHAEDPSLVAKVLYCVGRLHLHRGFHRDALKFFQLGQLAAQDSASELTVAMLCANEAWAYAFLKQPDQALKSIGRAQDEFARADRDSAPIWVRFFGLADLHAMTGMVYASLPSHDLSHRNQKYLTNAVENLTHSLNARDETMVRSRTFELTALATVHLALGNLTQGETIGNHAVDLAEQVRSVRTIDRLEPLEVEAYRNPDHSSTRDLAQRIATLRAPWVPPPTTQPRTG